MAQKAYRTTPNDPGPGSYESKMATALIEQPNVRPRKVREMNAIESLLLPDAAATVWPWGTVAMNRKRIEANKMDAGDVLGHELVHIRQQQQDGPWKTFMRDMTASPEYLARPHEQEALEYETRRPVRRGDIRLPASIESLRRK